MFLNTLGKNEMYHSVAEIMGTDIEHIKEYVKENADDIVGCGYNEYCIENMSLIKLIKMWNTSTSYRPTYSSSYYTERM